MKPQTTEAYIRNHVELARRCLANHALLRHEQWMDGHGLVTVGQPNGSSIYRCDIVLMPMRYLVMTGDLDTMCWGRFDGTTVRNAIAWMARESPADHYFVEKARIGMGARNMDVSTFVPEIALSDLIEHKKEAKREAYDEDDDASQARVDAWVEAIRFVSQDLADDKEGVQSLLGMLDEVDEDYEIRASLGRAPSHRLMWAWSIIRKADELLTLQERAPCRTPLCKESRKICGGESSIRRCACVPSAPCPSTP